MVEVMTEGMCVVTSDVQRLGQTVVPSSSEGDLLVAVLGVK
jgi:hypothetical protein